MSIRIRFLAAAADAPRALRSGPLIHIVYLDQSSRTACMAGHSRSGSSSFLCLQISRRREEPTLDPSPSYRNYIDWLAAQDTVRRTLLENRREGFHGADQGLPQISQHRSHGEVVTHEELGLQFQLSLRPSCRACAETPD